MPGMSHMKVNEARSLNADLIELKIDGSRITYHKGNIVSDRGVNRNERYSHVVEELKKINWKVRGEMAIPGGNVIQLNKAVNWHKAKYFVFDIYELDGKDVSHLSPSEGRKLIEKVLKGRKLKHITVPRKFSSFKQGWDYVKKHDAEGLVLKTKAGVCYKTKLLKEEKLPVVGHVKGKSKGAFLIEREGVQSKVSGTSEAFLKAYRILLKRGEQAYAEIEYSFLTDDGTPFQPRLRRLGTLDSLKFT